MNMIERVARALCATHGIDPDKQGYWGGSQVTFPAWGQYMQLAHAAIEAMREPSEEMIVACRKQWMVGSTADMAKREWTAMIDAALQEK